MRDHLAEGGPALDLLQQTGMQPFDANHRINELLAMLGHEMRNPLSALNHALQVWALSMQDPALMDELHQIMQRQVSQLTRLGDDLLDVARITQGKLELHCEPVNLRQVIDDACEQIRPFIESCSHVLTVRMPTQPIVLDGDASRLTQVFANLIQNAAKFTGGMGSLCVTVERQDETAVVRVCDNGRGIEEHLLPAVFDGFLRGNGTRNDGLGIGLQLVKTIVELHGGAVAARSEGIGQGSEFTVQLPLMTDVMPRPKTASPQHTSSDNGHGQRPPPHRILVVDDDRTSAGLLARILRSLGQIVTVVSDGPAAIQKVLDERPQIVFLDIVMRGMSGCEIALRLREFPDLDDVVLIALSGNGDEEHKRQAWDAGINKYCVKPASMAALAEMLCEIPPPPPPADLSESTTT